MIVDYAPRQSDLVKYWMNRRLRVASGVCCGILSAVLCLPAIALQKGSVADNSADANSLVRQMVAAYKDATTIQESSAATFTPSSGPPLSQSYFLKYASLNGLSVTVQDPINGSFGAYCDGVTLTVYSAAKSSFVRRSAPPDLAGVVKAISGLSHELTGTAFDQTLNPISFVLAPGMPREGSNFKRTGIQTVMGRKTYVVSGTADDAYLRTVLPDSATHGARIDQKELTLYIDAQTHLLLQARARIHWTSVSRNSAGKGRGFGFTFMERHIGTKINAPLQRTALAFLQPPGAIEIK